MNDAKNNKISEAAIENGIADAFIRILLNKGAINEETCKRMKSEVDCMQKKAS